MSNGNQSFDELLSRLKSEFATLVRTAPEARKEPRRKVAACLNALAVLAGLKPVQLGGIPLDEEADDFTIGEIPT